MFVCQQQAAAVDMGGTRPQAAAGAGRQVCAGRAGCRGAASWQHDNMSLYLDRLPERGDEGVEQGNVVDVWAQHARAGGPAAGWGEGHGAR